MILILRFVAAGMTALFAALVIWNLPYPYLSPRWFFTACGVAFMAAGFVGFVLPENKKGGE